MALLVVHPWAQFFAGMLLGCWIGATVACGGLLLFVGRRVRQLESVNLLLRRKLKARIPRHTGAMGLGPRLVMPFQDSFLEEAPPVTRIARVN
jgi:hypothetical protein